MRPGRVLCLAFVGADMRLLEGVTFTLPNGTHVTTGRRGSAFLTAPPGIHTLRVGLPAQLRTGEQAEVAIEQVVVASDVTTQVLLTFGPDGALVDAELLAPAAPVENLQEVEGDPEEFAAIDPGARDAGSVIDADEYVVHGRRIRGSVASVMEERRAATSVTDAIGAEDIRKSADGTASAATRRVVGATVVGGQYLFVRGLGGRYSNVRLNDVPLPSTDPDVPGFQLDLFPASLLSSLTIAKTFTPDMPGDFAGGSMNIGTRDFPDRFDLSASLGAAGDTRTLGKKVPTYAGGDLDFLGLDDGTRALPDEIPDRALARVAREDGGQERIIAISRSFPNRWKLQRQFSPPQMSLGLSLGNSTTIGGHRAGYLFTLGYRYNVQLLEERLVAVNYSGGELVARQELTREIGNQEAQLGVLGSVSYDLAKGHQLRAVALVTQTADDKTSLIGGQSDAENAEIRQTDYRFTERQLLFTQLLGGHDLSVAELDWQLNMALVDRSQPDTRSILYQRLPMSDDYAYNKAGGSGEHSYSELGQLDLGGGTNLTVPIAASKLKTGYLGRLSSRDLTGRRFGVTYTGRDSTLKLLPPEELFTPENVDDVWKSNELSSSKDGYDAKQLLNAGYGLAELAVTPWLRLTGGARIEAFYQRIETVSPAEGLPGRLPPTIDDTAVDVLPSGGLILGLGDDMSVRAAYGGTVARPLLRELSPASVQDFIRRRTIQGNPELDRTYIQNIDLRWELFPGRTEVVAASLFYKMFDDPIETVIQDPNGNLSYDNTQGAYAYGAEAEVRVGLGHLAEALDDLVLGLNLALIESEVELSDEQAEFATSRKRPLSGQSPYVANVTLGYSPAATGLSLNVFYNVFGRRIQEVGRSGLPDVYEEPFHSLDFTASYQLDDHWTLGATATNLLFQDSVVQQGDFEFSRIKRGSSFGVRLGFAN